MNLPILYSFRRCPYAIRARLGLVYSQQNVVVREVLLRDKPPSMLQLSPKGTVPVLVLQNGKVIDESLDVIAWALSRHDPEGLLTISANNSKIDELIKTNDFVFKPCLDRYKYFERYPERTQLEYRSEAEKFIQQLETLLASNTFLFADTFSLADIAIMPFVRQFAHVDKNWFYNSSYSNCQRWLQHWLQSPLFLAAMKKYPLWQDEEETNQFPLIEES